MSEEAAAVYEQGVNADRSAEEAWERVQARNAETEWDVVGMLGRRLSADDDGELEETA